MGFYEISSADRILGVFALAKLPHGQLIRKHGPRALAK